MRTDEAKFCISALPIGLLLETSSALFTAKLAEIADIQPRISELSYATTERPRAIQERKHYAAKNYLSDH